MASTINGWGTTYLGVGPPGDDDWRPATLWFVMFGMPILLLRRAILRPVDHSTTMQGESTELEIATTSGPRVIEVLRTFFVYWCIHLPLALGPLILSFVWLASNAEEKSESNLPIVAIFAGIVWIVAYSMIFGSGDGRRLKAASSGD